MSRKKNTQKPAKQQASSRYTISMGKGTTAEPLLPRLVPGEDQDEVTRFGRSKYWERAGMSGFSWTPAPKPKSGRKMTKKTIKILKESAKLVARGKSDLPLAPFYWPSLPEKVAQQRLRVLKSKHRPFHDALVEKHKQST